MANHLRVAKVLSIQALHDQGWSQRRIARELGINRETVARHLNPDSKPAKAPTGSDDSKPATASKAPTGSPESQPNSKPATGGKAPAVYLPLPDCCQRRWLEATDTVAFVLMVLAVLNFVHYSAFWKRGCKRGR